MANDSEISPTTTLRILYSPCLGSRAHESSYLFPQGDIPRTHRTQLKGTMQLLSSRVWLPTEHKAARVATLQSSSVKEAVAALTSCAGTSSWGSNPVLGFLAYLLQRRKSGQVFLTPPLLNPLRHGSRLRTSFPTCCESCWVHQIDTVHLSQGGTSGVQRIHRAGPGPHRHRTGNSKSGLGNWVVTMGKT